MIVCLHVLEIIVFLMRVCERACITLHCIAYGGNVLFCCHFRQMQLHTDFVRTGGCEQEFSSNFSLI